MKKVLNQILKLFYTHWHILFASLILGYSLAFLFSDNLIIYREDFAGHFQKAKNLKFPSLVQGWDTTSWSGFNQDLYPSLYHLYLRTFLNYFPQTLASQLSTSIIVTTQILCFWLLSKKLFSNHPKQKFSFALINLIYFSLPNSFLGSLHGTLLVGGLPAALGLLFVTLYIISNNSSKPNLQNSLFKSIILGLCILTHTLSAIVIGFITLFNIFKSQKYALLSTLLGLTIGLPWIWVFLNPHLTGSRINMSSTLSSLLIVIWILSLITYQALPKSKKSQTLITPLLIIGLISFIPIPVSDWLWKNKIVGFHFFRFQLFYLLLIPPFLIHNLNLSSKKIQITTTLASCSFLIYLIALNTPMFFNKPQVTTLPQIQQIKGRILDTTNTKPFSMPHLTTSVLSKHTSSDFGTNFFFESSPLSPLFYSLTYSINPSTYLLGANKEIIRKTLNLNPDLINPQQKLELLGINYLAHTQIPELAQEIAIPIITINPNLSNSNTNSQTETIYLIPTSDQASIVTLSQIPPVSSQSFEKWWPQASLDNLYIQEKIPTSANDSLDLTTPQISNIQANKQKISFVIDSKTPTPTLIKFAYNKYWQAFDQADKQIPIYWISPGFMFLIASGPTYLTWQYPPILESIQTISTITIIALMLILLILSHPKIKNMHNQK